MNTVYIQLGSNIGERKSYIAKSMEQIEENIGEIITASSVFKTTPWGNENQNNFLNSVIKINTTLRPQNATLGASTHSFVVES